VKHPLTSTILVSCNSIGFNHLSIHFSEVIYSSIFNFLKLISRDFSYANKLFKNRSISDTLFFFILFRSHKNSLTKTTILKDTIMRSNLKYFFIYRPFKTMTYNSNLNFFYLIINSVQGIK
jgi:hypothetical protein